MKLYLAKYVVATPKQGESKHLHQRAQLAVFQKNIQVLHLLSSFGSTIVRNSQLRIASKHLPCRHAALEMKLRKMKRFRLLQTVTDGVLFAAAGQTSSTGLMLLPSHVRMAVNLLQASEFYAYLASLHLIIGLLAMSVLFVERTASGLAAWALQQIEEAIEIVIFLRHSLRIWQYAITMIFWIMYIIPCLIVPCLQVSVLLQNGCDLLVYTCIGDSNHK